MKRLVYFCIGLALLGPTAARAGQVYGSISFGGRPVARADIEINCGGARTSGATAPDGSYRINVAQQGQCTLTLTQYPGASAVVFSYPNPSLYNFELVQTGNSYALRRK